MSKGSILESVEPYKKTGVGELIRRIAGRDSSTDHGCLLPGRTSNRPAVRTQVRGAGETDLVDPLPDPLGHPAALLQHSAQKHGHLNRLLVNKRASRDAGAWAPRSRGVTRSA